MSPQVSPFLRMVAVMMTFWTSAATVHDKLYMQQLGTNVSDVLNALMDEAKYDRRIRPGFGGEFADAALVLEPFPTPCLTEFDTTAILCFS